MGWLQKCDDALLQCHSRPVGRLWFSQGGAAADRILIFYLCRFLYSICVRVKEYFQFLPCKVPDVKMSLSVAIAAELGKT